MIHDALKLIRECHGLKQTELAKRLNISTSYLSEMERGKKSFTLYLLNKYSLFFGVPTSTFFIINEELLNRVNVKQKDKAFRVIDSIRLALEIEL